jgi:hypothetical protein
LVKAHRDFAISNIVRSGHFQWPEWEQLVAAHANATAGWLLPREWFFKVERTVAFHKHSLAIACRIEAEVIEESAEFLPISKARAVFEEFGRKYKDQLTGDRPEQPGSVYLRVESFGHENPNVPADVCPCCEGIPWQIGGISGRPNHESDKS